MSRFIHTAQALLPLFAVAALTVLAPVYPGAALTEAVELEMQCGCGHDASMQCHCGCADAPDGPVSPWVSADTVAVVAGQDDLCAPSSGPTATTVASGYPSTDRATHQLRSRAPPPPRASIFLLTQVFRC